MVRTEMEKGIRDTVCIDVRAGIKDQPCWICEMFEECKKKQSFIDCFVLSREAEENLEVLIEGALDWIHIEIADAIKKNADYIEILKKKKEVKEYLVDAILNNLILITDTFYKERE